MSNNGSPEDFNLEYPREIPYYGSNESSFDFIDPNDLNGGDDHTSIITPQEAANPTPITQETAHPTELPDTSTENPTPATAEQDISHEGFRAEIGMFSMGKPGHENEDAIHASSDLVMCIADGVGSTPTAGDAAYIATEVFTNYIEHHREELKTAADERVQQIATEGVSLITENFNRGQKDPNILLHPKASTTFGAVILMPSSENKPDSAGRALAVGIGDSPAMLVRNGKASVITEEQTGKNRKDISNWLATGKKGGRQVTPANDQYKFVDLQPGDRIVMATDGLMGDKIPERTPLEYIAATVEKNDDPQMAAYALAALPGRLQSEGKKAYNPQTEQMDIPFKAKNDDLTVGVIAIPDERVKVRHRSSDEIIAQQPENERHSLITLDLLLNELGDKSQIIQIIDDAMPGHADSEVEEIKNYIYQGAKSEDVMADLQRAIQSGDPDTQNVKDALLENPANIAHNLAAFRATLSYLIDLPLTTPDTVVGQSAEVYQRLVAIRGLLLSPEKEVDGNA